MEFNGTFLASIVSFIVFVFLMNKVLYAPMGKIVKERKGNKLKQKEEVV